MPLRSEADDAARRLWNSAPILLLSTSQANWAAALPASLHGVPVAGPINGDRIGRAATYAHFAFTRNQ